MYMVKVMAMKNGYKLGVKTERGVPWPGQTQNEKTVIYDIE